MGRGEYVILQKISQNLFNMASCILYNGLLNLTLHVFPILLDLRGRQVVIHLLKIEYWVVFSSLVLPVLCHLLFGPGLAELPHQRVYVLDGILNVGDAGRCKGKAPLEKISA